MTVMEQGKQICNVLKDVRRKAAMACGIDYSPTECSHQGECAGTCPKCEQELAWFDSQIRSRSPRGLSAVAGVALGVAAVMPLTVSCDPFVVRTEGDIPDDGGEEKQESARQDAMLVGELAQDKAWTVE